jgi:hypothetical protein
MTIHPAASEHEVAYQDVVAPPKMDAGNLTTLEILTAARALLAEPERWTQREYARNSSGFPVGACDPSATCFCMIGAIKRAGGFEYDARIPLDVIAHLRAAIATRDQTNWNDTRSHADVLRAMDRAIELARAS